MATHSSVLAWKIPWTEEPRGLQSMGLQSDMTECAHNTHTYGETESMCVCWHYLSVQKNFNNSVIILVVPLRNYSEHRLK